MNILKGWGVWRIGVVGTVASGARTKNTSLQGCYAHDTMPTMVLPSCEYVCNGTEESKVC